MLGTTKLKNSGIYLCLCLLKAPHWLWHTIRRVDVINLSLAVCVYLVRTQINSVQLFVYIVSSSSCFRCGFYEYSLVTVTHTRIREKKLCIIWHWKLWQNKRYFGLGDFRHHQIFRAISFRRVICFPRLFHQQYGPLSGFIFAVILFFSRSSYRPSRIVAINNRMCLIATARLWTTHI